MTASQFSAVMRTLEPDILFDFESLSKEELLNMPSEELRERLFNDTLEKFLCVNSEEKTPSTYFMQKFDEAIKKLPLKIREKVCKDYVETQVNERYMMGWDDVLEEISLMPIDAKTMQVSTVSNCEECGIGYFSGDPPFCRKCSVFFEELALIELD